MFQHSLISDILVRVILQRTTLKVRQHFAENCRTFAKKIGHKATPVLFFKWSCRAALADVGKQLGELAVPVAVLLANVLGLLALYKWFEQSKRGRLEGTNPEWTRTVPRAVYLNNIEYY